MAAPGRVTKQMPLGDPANLETEWVTVVEEAKGWECCCCGREYQDPREAKRCENAHEYLETVGFYGEE